MGKFFLPPSLVEDEFIQLMYIAPGIEHAIHFSDYVLHNYVSEIQLFNLLCG